MKSNGKNGKGVKWWVDVPPIVPGQELYSPAQMRLLLGDICKTTYYLLRQRGLLKFSRLDKGKQVVHTLQQYQDFVALMNGEYEVKIGEYEVKISAVKISARQAPRLVSSARAAVVDCERSRLGRTG